MTTTEDDAIAVPRQGSRQSSPEQDDNVSDSQEIGLAESRSLALRSAEILSETPAANTLVMDIHELTPYADFFVICSGENERQLRAITNELLEEMAEDGMRPKRTEGDAAAGWTILDYGDVVIHIFDEDQRAFYRLEELWSAGTTVLTIE